MDNLHSYKDREKAVINYIYSYLHSKDRIDRKIKLVLIVLNYRKYLELRKELRDKVYLGKRNVLLIIDKNYLRVVYISFKYKTYLK